MANALHKIPLTQNKTMRVLPQIRSRKVTVTAVAGKCLNIECFRGFAPASLLAAISRPDIYLQYSNPDGTQRDLSPDKARRAYEYMATMSDGNENDARFFTEVVLNVREPRVVRIVRQKGGIAQITFLLEELDKVVDAPAISRVEGNHRLALVGGSSTYNPVDVSISFCITIGIARKSEAKIFRDINSNQRPMNTSHLDNIDLKLGGRSRSKIAEHLRIADRLASDRNSPFLDLVYRGGKRPIGVQFAVSLRTLSNLARLMIARSEVLGELAFEEKYEYIRDYWSCIASIFSEQWNDGDRRYVMMKSAGLTALAMLGAAVVDMVEGRGRKRRHSDLLESMVTRIDWSSGGALQGLNGLGGANIIFNRYLLPLVERGKIA